VPVKYSKQLHSRPASEIIYAYCDVLIFTFYGWLARTNVCHCKAAADATAARSRVIPIELFALIVETQGSFKTKQWVGRRSAMRRAKATSFGGRQNVTILFTRQAHLNIGRAGGDDGFGLCARPATHDRWTAGAGTPDGTKKLDNP